MMRGVLQIPAARAVRAAPTRGALAACAWVAAFGLRRRGLLQPAEPAQHRVGGALARFPGAADRAPQRLVRGFAGEPDGVAHRLHQDAARGLPARRRGRRRRRAPRLGVPARGAGALDRLFHVGAVKPRQPFAGEIDHGGFALRREIAAERAGDFDQAKRRAGDVGEDRGGVRVDRFLEHQIVAFEAERIADEFERDVVVAAERELAEGVESAAAAVRA